MLRTTAALMLLPMHRMLETAAVCQLIGHSEVSASSFEALLLQAILRPRQAILGVPGGSRKGPAGVPGGSRRLWEDPGKVPGGP